MRWVFRAATGLVVLAVVLVAAAFVFRMVRQGATESSIRIEAPGGIQEAGLVDINGEKQWIQIRGQDATKPVVLFLAGGPGGTMIPLLQKSDLAWERDFVMVHWDQSGAGKTHLANKGKETPLTVDRMTKDGIAVAEYLNAKFGRKIILLGHSWGSMLGVEMVRRRPDLFAAYVGTGQVVEMKGNESIGYARLLDRVTKAGRTRDIEKLKAIGAPPYASQDELFAERGVLDDNPIPSERGLTMKLILTAVFAPGYSLPEIAEVGNPKPDERLMAEVMTYNIRDKGLAFGVPMIVIQGADDIQTPTELVGPFMEELTAPYKKLELLPGGGHMAVVVMSDAFLARFKSALAAIPN